MSNITCYTCMWVERILCADYDYIRNFLIRSIYMSLFEKKELDQPPYYLKHTCTPVLSATTHVLKRAN